jgi:hypothetical protein
MKIKYGINLFIMGFLFNNNTIAQSYKYESEIYKAYIKNLQDSALVTGFYKVTLKYLTEEDYNYHIEYKQNIKDIEVKKDFLIFKRKIKIHYVYSTSNIVAKEKKSYNRYLPGTHLAYQINPFPIALKENIIRIYDYKKIEPDSSFNAGLIFKLNFCVDTGLCMNNELNHKERSQIGLVINNQLISVSDIYIKEKLNYSGSLYEQYLVFIFPKQIANKIEYYKKELFRQTLIKK